MIISVHELHNVSKSLCPLPSCSLQVFLPYSLIEVTDPLLFCFLIAKQL